MKTLLARIALTRLFWAGTRLTLIHVKSGMDPRRAAYEAFQQIADSIVVA